MLDNVNISNGLGSGINCDEPIGGGFSEGSFVRILSNVQITGITDVMIDSDCNIF